MLANRVSATGTRAAVKAERAPRVHRFIEGPVAPRDQSANLEEMIALAK